MTTDDIQRVASLVDDLCLVMSGWRTDDEHKAFLQAHSRIAKRGAELQQLQEIERLKARIQELEGKP
jgi:hypothetical protein